MRFQIGAFFPTRDMPADHVAIRDWAQAAEGIGYDFLAVSDHVLGVDRTAWPDFKGSYDVNDAFHETFVTLAYIAAVTERVGLASGVLILPQRRRHSLPNRPLSSISFLVGGCVWALASTGIQWNTRLSVRIGMCAADARQSRLSS